jgi:hypothetical protein
MARHKTWSKTLLAMVLAAIGVHAALRPLADTVEYWGQRSNYGRDRRAHHYVRGMLLVAQKRDAGAATELREAIYSPTNGFTRVNYELGRVLVRLGRAERRCRSSARALHGELDGSSLYVSRTELHELLAQAFDAWACRTARRCTIARWRKRGRRPIRCSGPGATTRACGSRGTPPPHHVRLRRQRRLRSQRTVTVPVTPFSVFIGVREGDTPREVDAHRRRQLLVALHLAPIQLRRWR